MKAFFEEYGRILVSALVILLFVVSASPLGGSIKDGITGVVQSMNRLDGEGGSGGGNGSSGGEEEVVPVLAAGLYDADDNLVADWDTLVNTYGMNVSKNLVSGNYNVVTSSPYCVLTKNSDLSSGVKLIISEGVTSIGDYAFNSCTGLTSVTIPEGVMSIGKYTFENCTNLTSVKIPSTITSIGVTAFRYCTSLTSVTIPKGVTSIANYAFNGCSGLTSVTIPEGVTSIGQYAFEDCTKLTSVTIPEGVTKIDAAAFRECSSLTSVTIPSTVNLIGEEAFYKCTGLTSVYLKQTEVPKFYWGCFKKSSDNICTFYFKNSTVAAAFTTTYYEASNGIKSTDYNW